jgi:hypothetical protein
MTDVARADGGRPATWERVSIVDILDRVLGTGVVITGDVTISIADVDLVYISLHALVASVRPDGPGPIPAVPTVVREAW